MSFPTAPEYSPPPYSYDPPTFPTCNFSESATSNINFPAVPPPEFPSFSTAFPAFPSPPQFPSLCPPDALDDTRVNVSITAPVLPVSSPFGSEQNSIAAALPSYESISTPAAPPASQPPMPQLPVAPPPPAVAGHYVQYRAAIPSDPAYRSSPGVECRQPTGNLLSTVPSTSPARTRVRLLEGEESAREPQTGPCVGLVTARQESTTSNWSSSNAECLFEACKNKCIRSFIILVVLGIILLIINSAHPKEKYSYKLCNRFLFEL